MMQQQSPGSPRLAPQNDLYTALLIFAAVLLLGGTIFLMVRSYQLFGNLMPSGGTGG